MEVRDGLINILMASNAQMNLYLRKNMFFRLFFFLMSKHILITTTENLIVDNLIGLLWLGEFDLGQEDHELP